MILLDPQKFLDEGEKQIQATLSPADLEINEPTIRADAPATVELVARRLGSEILVQGEIKIILQAQCGRCAEWIPWPVQVPDFATSVAVTDSQPIDLTPSLREDILLALPVVTVCPPGAHFPCAQRGQQFPWEKAPVSLHEDVWSALDKIKIKTKKKKKD